MDQTIFQTLYNGLSVFLMCFPDLHSEEHDVDPGARVARLETEEILWV